MLSYENRNRVTLNRLKTVFFDFPEWTPAAAYFLPAVWKKYGRDLEDLVLSHPRLWPGHKRQDPSRFGEVTDVFMKAGRFTDCWGVVWENVAEGLSSHPVAAPLSDWDALESYRPPDGLRDGPTGPREDWNALARRMAESRAAGGLASAGPLIHGFMFMYLFYLRGFENFLIDVATDDPRLPRLIKMVEDYNFAVIRKTLECGAEWISFGDDLGMQHALPMSPAHWRKYIKPSYDRLLAPCRHAGAAVYLHTDGKIVEIIPDLVEVGVDVLNPQLRGNELEGWVRVAKGNVCLNQDLDRQLFPFATPSQLADHVAEVHDALHDPRGGLMLVAEISPDIPLANIEAIAAALEKVCRLPEL